VCRKQQLASLPMVLLFISCARPQLLVLLLQQQQQQQHDIQFSSAAGVYSSCSNQLLLTPCPSCSLGQLHHLLEPGFLQLTTTVT
jgi:hypothetical protein